MRIANIIVSVILLLVCLVFYWQTRDFPPSLSANDVGPAYFPHLIMVLLAAFCIFLIVRSVKKYGEGSKGTFAIPRTALWGIMLAVGYVVLMPLINYYLVTALATLSGMYIMGIRKPVPLIGVTLALILFIHFIFFKWLGLVSPSLL